MFSKLEHFIMLNSVVIQEPIVITHFYSGYVYVIYYSTIITSVIIPCDDPDETERPCLRAGCHIFSTPGTTQIPPPNL
jgi:hypothetical protein